MLALVNTNESIELVTANSGSIDWVVTYVDSTATTHTPSSTQGKITTNTTTTIIPSPGASTNRKVSNIMVTNVHTSANNITIQRDVGGTNYRVFPTIVLSPGDSLQYNDTNGFSILGSNGLQKVQATEQVGVGGYTANFYKVGTAAEAAGSYYCGSKDNGFPGAWSPGSAGVAGRQCLGTSSSDTGCIPYYNASSGNNYLQAFMAAGSTGHLICIADFMWVNNGLSVTATTAQTVNSVVLPPRDMNNSTSGVGVMAAILITTATTQAGAITGTLNYTNSQGTPGRIATATIPATAVVGTLIPFNLSSGNGVQSIQSFTLAGTLTTGAYSLVLMRQLAVCPSVLSNIGNTSWPANTQPGIRLYDDTCLISYYLASATTATNIAGQITIIER